VGAQYIALEEHLLVPFTLTLTHLWSSIDLVAKLVGVCVCCVWGGEVSIIDGVNKYRTSASQRASAMNNLAGKHEKRVVSYYKRLL
jgi:hypothetical protein